MANCNYKVNIKDIQSKYSFKIFCSGDNSDIQAEIGNLENLTTTAKDNLVNAINEVDENLSTKQDTLVSGTNIKTINNGTILGSGNLNLEETSNKVTSINSSSTDTQYPSAKLLYNQLSSKQDTLVSGTNIKTINNGTILGSGNLNLEETSNKVTSINSSSTDTQYPSAKLLYDSQEAQNTVINKTKDDLKETQEELDYYKTIYNVLPKVVGNGEDISLKNTGESILKMELSPSELEQDSTNGRNLLDSKLTNQTYRSVNISYDEKEQIITLNGNYDSSSTGEINLPQLSSNNITVPTNGTIYANVEYVSGSSTGHFKVRLANSGFNKMIDVDYPSGVNQSQSSNSVLSTTDNITLSNGRLYIYEGATFSNLKIKLYASIVSNVYEPYTNGASPNPDYPQEVKRIWGDNNLIISNNNLLESQTTYSTTGGSSGGVAYTRLDNFTPITSPITLSAAYKGIAFVSKVKKGLTYTFSSDVTNMTGSTVSIYEKFEDMTDRTKQLERFASATFTPNYDGYALLCMYSNSSSSREHSWTYGKLELGTVATDYVPHEGKKLSLNLGVKNLFDKDNVDTGKYYKTSEIDTSENWNIYQALVQPNTSYYLSGNNYNNNTAKIVLLDSSKNILSSVGGYYDTHLITTSATTKYIGLSCHNNDIETLQLEEGSVAHSYSEYGVEPVEYCKIGNYKDKFFYNSSKREDYIDTLEDGKWYLKKNVGKAVLNGSETWSTSASNTSGIYRLYTNNIKSLVLKPANSNTRALIKCSHYIVKTASDTYRKVIGIAIDETGVLFIYDDNYNTSTSVTDFESWLSTHNTTVYYVLKTPQYVLLNNTIQKQLTDIAKMLSYNEETNISQENDQLAFIINAIALMLISGE